MQTKPARNQTKHAVIFVTFFPVFLKTKLLPWAAPFHDCLWYHQGGDQACWLQISNRMQSSPIACLTFACTPEDPMPVFSGTSPSNSSCQMSATFQWALIRLTLLSASKTPSLHQPASMRLLKEQNDTLMPATSSPVSPQWWHLSECSLPRVTPVAQWSQGSWTRQPETAMLQAGQRCEDGLAQ